jgi:hypothetical protein
MNFDLTINNYNINELRDFALAIVKYDEDEFTTIFDMTLPSQDKELTDFDIEFVKKLSNFIFMDKL